MTLVNIKGFEEKTNIYSDLCRRLISYGHTVDIICPDENPSFDGKYSSEKYGSSKMIKISTGKIQKTGLLKKGISTLTVGYKFEAAVKANCADRKYDIVIYSTPPITLIPAIKYIKKRDGAMCYLLLKDIFPQNAADIGIMSDKGPKSFIYRYFRKEEIKLYKISDFIGCMSEANLRYLKNHNSFIDGSKIHINPNSIEVSPKENKGIIKSEIRKKYNIPENATALLYGGNLGKPQDAEHIIKCLELLRNNDKYFLYICGNGTEYSKIQSYIENAKPDNIKLIKWMKRDEYENFVNAFDIGLIFLDHRFTIPNFPSRILSYMQAKIPVLACTDKNTDIREAIEGGGFGGWCESRDPEDFISCVEKLSESDLDVMGENAYIYLKNNYDVSKSADIIMDSYYKFGEKNENS